MVAVLDELELTALVTSITGIYAVGAATIPAETGDPNRFATARALVKHAGLAPRVKSSGTFTGRTKTRCLTSRRGGAQTDGRGEPCAALRTTEYLDAHHGQPRPSSHQPDYTLLGTIPIRLCRDRRRTRHRPNP